MRIEDIINATNDLRVHNVAITSTKIAEKLKLNPDTGRPYTRQHIITILHGDPRGLAILKEIKGRHWRAKVVKRPVIINYNPSVTSWLNERIVADAVLIEPDKVEESKALLVGAAVYGELTIELAATTNSMWLAYLNGILINGTKSSGGMVYPQDDLWYNTRLKGYAIRKRRSIC